MDVYEPGAWETYKPYKIKTLSVKKITLTFYVQVSLCNWNTRWSDTLSFWEMRGVYCVTGMHAELLPGVVEQWESTAYENPTTELDKLLLETPIYLLQTISRSNEPICMG